MKGMGDELNEHGDSDGCRYRYEDLGNSNLANTQKNGASCSEYIGLSMCFVFGHRSSGKVLSSFCELSPIIP